MSETRQNIIVAGAFLLGLVIVFFMSNPQDIFATTSFIDSDLIGSKESQVPVTTRLELASPEYLKLFPALIGSWQGYDVDSSSLSDATGAIMTLLRTYRTDDGQTVDLLILYTRNPDKLTPTVVCYPSPEYHLEENGNDLVYVKDVSWLKRRNRQIDTGKLPEWMKEEVQNTPLSELGFWVSVKKLVLVKQENGVIKDRQIVLYFYIKDRSIAPRYGMLRATAEAPLSGNYDAPLQSIKDLMGDAIPLMFEPVQSERIYLSIVADRGAAGYAIIFMLFLIPLAVIAFPVWRNAVEKGTVRPISFRNNKE